MKPITIQGKELVKQVSIASGYHSYEVQDILTSLAICLAENSKLGYSTCIKGIGTFKVKKGYSIKGKSNLTGENYDTISRNTLSFKVDSIMGNALNDGVD